MGFHRVSFHNLENILVIFVAHRLMWIVKMNDIDKIDVQVITRRDDGTEDVE